MPGLKSNGTEITFGTPTSNVTITGWAVWDGSTMIIGKAFSPSVSAVSGQPIKFLVGELDIEETGWANDTAKAILDSILGDGSPTNVTIRLYTANPNFATGSGGTEVAVSGYSAQTITNNTTNWPNATTV